MNLQPDHTDRAFRAAFAVMVEDTPPAPEWEYVAPDATTQTVPTLPPRPGWATALAAAAIILVLVGGMALGAVVLGSAEDATNEPPTPTLPAPPEEATPTTLLSTTPSIATLPTSPLIAGPEFSRRLTAEDLAEGWSWVPTGLPLRDVVPASKGFVGVGDGIGATSPDGLEWTASPFSPDPRIGTNPTTVYTTSHGLIAMGSRWLREPLAPTGSEVEEYGLWSSPDGSEWTWLPLGLETIYREDPGPWDSYWMVDVAERSGNLLAVVGTNHYEGAPDEQPEQHTLVFASSDGESWEREAITSIFEGASIGKVLGAAPGFIAVGKNGAGALSAWVSEDGSSWSKSVLAATGVGFVGEIIEFDDHFVVLGWDESGPITWTSEDGTDWVAAAQSDSKTAYGYGRFQHNIAVIGPNLIATGMAEGEPLWWISHDGIMWSQGRSESGLLPNSGDLGEGSVDSHINDIFAIEGNRLVALGFHGGELTDGLWVWSRPEN